MMQGNLIQIFNHRKIFLHQHLMESIDRWESIEKSPNHMEYLDLSIDF